MRGHHARSETMTSPHSGSHRRYAHLSVIRERSPQTRRMQARRTPSSSTWAGCDARCVFARASLATPVGWKRLRSQRTSTEHGATARPWLQFD